MLSYDPSCIEPPREMYLDLSEKCIGPPGTPGTFHVFICAIGHVTRLDNEPRLSIRIVIWILKIGSQEIVCHGHSRMSFEKKHRTIKQTIS